MSVLRAAGLAVLVMLAVALQVAVLRYVSVDGVAPNLALLLVVAAGFLRGPQYAAGLGFAAGLVLDVAPPADHTAGRWALALVVAGYLAGRVRTDARSSIGAASMGAASTGAALATVAGCSFIAGSIYALTGLAVGDDHLATGRMVVAIVIGVVWDVAAAPLLLPLGRLVLGRFRPARVGW